jgi:regulator of replication initiation timing
LSQVKLFTFNASSFPLDPSIEGFLKSKGAISLDFGTFAYVNSETMPAVLTELVERAKTEVSSNTDLVAQLKAEVGRYSVERQKIIEDSARFASQVKSYSAEIVALKDQAAAAAKLIETLKAENTRLQTTAKGTSSTILPPPTMNDDKMRQSYEKLVRDYQALRAQSAEALTSLKVLEDENEELMLQLEHLQNQLKNATAPKID